MPKTKQILKLEQQRLSKVFSVLVGQGGQKPNIPNQVGQTKLLQLVGVFDIRTEKIAYYRALVGLSQDFFQNLGRTRFGDIEKT